MNDSVFVCLPEEADIVLGFVKVGGGSGLLSMIVPEEQTSFSYFTRRMNSVLCSHKGC